MKAFTAACFFALVLLAVGGASCAAGAAQTNWPAARRPDGKPQAWKSVEVQGNRLVIRADNKAPREFRCMFDIANRSKDKRAKKKKKGEK